jgi:hypothetical protein
MTIDPDEGSDPTLLDAAWRRVEAELPKGWDFGLTRRMDGRYSASAAGSGLDGIYEVAETPTRALLNLALALRETRPTGPRRRKCWQRVMAAIRTPERK